MRDEGFVERRQEQRYPIVLPVDVEQATSDTRDISISGLYFKTKKSFSPGTPIELTLSWKSTLPSTPMRLHCKGQVVRAERYEGKWGVAVAIESYGFEISGESTGST